MDAHQAWEQAVDADWRARLRFREVIRPDAPREDVQRATGEVTRCAAALREAEARLDEYNPERFAAGSYWYQHAIAIGHIGWWTFNEAFLRKQLKGRPVSAWGSLDRSYAWFPEPTLERRLLRDGLWYTARHGVPEWHFVAPEWGRATRVIPAEEA